MIAGQILVNGEATAAVSALDRGFQYGDGVFETVAVCRGTPLLWERHLVRLRQGVQRLGIPLPSLDLLADEARGLCASVGERAVLKVIVTRGVGTRGYATDPSGMPTRVLYLAAW